MSRAHWSSLLVVAVLCACTGSAGPLTFNATFPAETTRDIDPIAVSFIDQTGLVSSMSLAPAEAGVAQVSLEPGDPAALRIEWPGSKCDGRISLVMADSGPGYSVIVHVSPSIGSGFGCPTEQVFRALTIRVREPLDPALFSIDQVYP